MITILFYKSLYLFVVITGMITVLFFKSLQLFTCCYLKKDNDLFLTPYLLSSCYHRNDNFYNFLFIVITNMITSVGLNLKYILNIIYSWLFSSWSLCVTLRFSILQKKDLRSSLHYKHFVLLSLTRKLPRSFISPFDLQLQLLIASLILFSRIQFYRCALMRSVRSLLHSFDWILFGMHMPSFHSYKNTHS